MGVRPAVHYRMVVEKEVRVAPAALATLADSTLTAAKGLSRAQFDAQVELTVPSPVFGNCAGAAELHAAHQDLVEAMDAACDGLVGTLEIGVDQLYQVAFAYKQLDEQATRRIASAASSLDSGSSF